jgi:hypothetical protein
LRLTDYGYPSTIPSAGETLATGSIIRYVAAKVMTVATKASRHLSFQIPGIDVQQNDDVALRFGLVRHVMASSLVLASPKVIFPVLKEIIFGR